MARFFVHFILSRRTFFFLFSPPGTSVALASAPGLLLSSFKSVDAAHPKYFPVMAYFTDKCRYDD